MIRNAEKHLYQPNFSTQLKNTKKNLYKKCPTDQSAGSSLTEEL